MQNMLYKNMLYKNMLYKNMLYKNMLYKNMLYIGIDLSDNFFDSCITNSQGAVLSTKRFDLSHDGFCSFIKLVHETENHKSIIGLENPRSRLVDFLAGRGYTVMLTNPNAISSYRKSRKPSRAKSDKDDAKLIADYLREHHTSLRCIQIPDETMREISLLLEDRDRLVHQKVRFSNQLTSTLKEYFPQALDAFGCIDSKCTIKFLKRIDTYAQLKALSAKKLEQLLKDCGVYRTDSKERFYQAIRKPVYHISQAVVKTKTRLKNTLVAHLDLLIQQIQEYETQIQSLMDDSPNGHIFMSLPGADYILGAKLLVLYSTRDFTDASEAQQLFGTAPYTAASGQSRFIGFRKGANKLGRNTFQQFARCSINSSNWANKQYVRRRNQGKGSQHSFRCLANTWVKITFAMWRSKTTYDENRHMASITNHIVNQPAFINGD
jgi:transposase